MKYLLKIINGTDCFRRILVTSTEQHLYNGNDGGSAGRWRGFRRSLLFGKLERTAAQSATSEKGNSSSPHSKLRNCYWSEVRGAGCTIYIGVSLGAFLSEVVGENGMIVEDNVCIHNSGQQLDVNKLNNQRHRSSGKGGLDLDADDY